MRKGGKAGLLATRLFAGLEMSVAKLLLSIAIAVLP